jgi:hypothetical protein
VTPEEGGASEAAGDASAGRRRRIACRALLILMTLLAYSDSFRVPFYFDDHRNIADNPLIKDLALYAQPWRAHEVQASGSQLNGFQTRFVAYLTFALDYRLHGTRVTGYHVVNLAIHIGAALLLFGIVRRAIALPFFGRSRLRGREESVALAAAALFALHPVQTQAVTYVVQRMASLAGCLCLLGLWSYLRARVEVAGPGPLRFLLPSLALAAAVLTKQNAVAFPAAIILFEFGFLPGEWRTKLRWLAAPLLAMALALGVILLPYLRTVAAAPGSNLIDVFADITRETEKISRHDYILTETRVVVTYLRLLVLPVRQNLDYDYPISHSLADPGVLRSLLLETGICGLGLALFALGGRKLDAGWRLAGFGVLWFFALQIIESGLIPIRDVIYEHRLYLPSAGFFISVATATAMVPRERPRRFLFALLAALALAAAGATWARNLVWSDEVYFWRDVAAKSPGKARVLYNLGYLLRREGKYPEAEVWFGRAVALDPRHRSALVNLGGLARMRGDLEAAASFYQRAFEARPTDWTILLDLRTVRIAQNRPDEAARLWSESVRLAGSEAQVRGAMTRAGAASLIPAGSLPEP